MALRKELRDRVACMSQQLRLMAFGEAGLEWGVSFTELESLGVELGDTLAQMFIAQSARQQAEEHAPTSCTCSCGHSARRRVVDEQAASQPRVITTRRGEVGWIENEYYCDRCRKSFFPSVQSFGDRARRDHESGGAGEGGSGVGS
jgi:hypothetical protein